MIVLLKVRESKPLFLYVDAILIFIYAEYLLDKLRSGFGMLRTVQTLTEYLIALEVSRARVKLCARIRSLSLQVRHLVDELAYGVYNMSWTKLTKNHLTVLVLSTAEKNEVTGVKLTSTGLVRLLWTRSCRELSWIR